MSETPLLAIGHVYKSFKSGGLFSATKTVAVNDVSIAIDSKPRVLSIVGESGSGKTTLARMVLRLVDPTEGKISLLGRPIAGTGNERFSDFEFRRTVQPIFQNPFEAFSAYLPSKTIWSGQRAI